MGEVAAPANLVRGPGIALGVLLATSTLAVVGFSAGPVVLSRDGVTVGIAAVGAVLLGVDALRRHSGPGLPWGPLLLRAVGVAVLLLPLFISAGPARLPPELRESAPQPPPPEMRPGSDSGFASTVDHAFLVLLIALAIGLMLWSGILGWLLRRIRLLTLPRVRVTPGVPGEPGESRDEVRPTSRSKALRRAADALGGNDNARQAVIAAYVVLERHLEEVTPRRTAETAHEFVSRVLRHDARLDAAHVDALLEIFGVARFSALPVSDDDAARARGHLHALVGG